MGFVNRLKQILQHLEASWRSSTTNFLWTLPRPQSLLITPGQPYFQYCSQVWGGLGSTLSDKLQRLQNRAVRIITKCGYDVRSHILLQNLNLKNLEIRRNQQLATIMFKVRNAMTPSSISNLFQRVDDVHNRQTRQMHFNYLPPKPNTNFKVAWNSLPCDLKKPQSIQSFKNKLRLITQ
mgnify:FL=1